jgi:hypothetical protein
MEFLHNLWVWAQANPWTVVAIVVYLVVNLAPRPHPEDSVGWKAKLWMILDRISVLTAERVPGKLKLIFAASPKVKTKPSEKDSQGKDG